MSQITMVVPRSLLPRARRFTPWSEAAPIIDEFAAQARWITRAEAEGSTALVQPIPCGVITDGAGRWCVFRTGDEERPELARRLSLVIGGHPDPLDNADGSLIRTWHAALERELHEEVKVTLRSAPQPLGLVLDGRTVASSRHVGIAFQLVAAGPVEPNSGSEFLTRSPLTGRFLAVHEIAGRSKDFDPWSQILIQEVLGTGGVQLPGALSQIPLALAIDD